MIFKKQIMHISVLNGFELYTFWACMNTKMFKIAFWMKKHLAMTWKRTWMWSTSPRVSRLDLGPLLPSEKVSTVQTTKRKKTQDGKVKWQGTKDLKGTQFFDRNLYHSHRVLFRIRIMYAPTSTIVLDKKPCLQGIYLSICSQRGAVIPWLCWRWTPKQIASGTWWHSVVFFELPFLFQVN